MIICYKHNGYDVIKQSVVDPITFKHFAYLFNCTLLDQLFYLHLFFRLKLYKLSLGNRLATCFGMGLLTLLAISSVLFVAVQFYFSAFPVYLMLRICGSDCINCCVHFLL